MRKVKCCECNKLMATDYMSYLNIHLCIDCEDKLKITPEEWRRLARQKYWDSVSNMDKDKRKVT